MICLCCGKEIREDAHTDEIVNQWHRSCIKRFFGTKTMPEIDISEDVLKNLANLNTQNGYTVPGVQKKLSLHLENHNNTSRLTLVNYPTGYILKPQTEDYRAMPESEYLVMSMAQKAGINTVPFAMIKDFKLENFAYITKRIDRVMPVKNGEEMKMLAMEDFCQLDGKLTENKYIGSYERCGKIISKYSSQPGIDKSEFFLRRVFCYVSGNSDMHLKNFSLIENPNGPGEYSLSRRYDLLPVNVILPADTEETALTLNGKKKNLRKKDFMALAFNMKLDEKIATRLLKKIVSMKDTFLKMTEQSLIPNDMKENFKMLISKRCEMLK